MSESPARHRGTRIASRAALALAALAFAASALAAPVELPQSDGTTLTLAHPAERLITLSPHLTELVYAAGAGDRLIATVAYSEYPAQAAGLPRIGDAFRLDLERILALKPDLVLAWDSGNPKPAVARLRSLGVVTWVTEIRRPEEIALMLERLGEAAATAEAGRAAADSFRDRLAALAADYAGRPEVSYFYQVDARPLYTIGSDHLIAHSLALCGARNVFAAVSARGQQITREAVIAADPEALLAPAIGPGDDPLAEWREWPTLRAVRAGALFLLPADAISRATPRLLDAVATACSLMHREVHGTTIEEDI